MAAIRGDLRSPAVEGADASGAATAFDFLLFPAGAALGLRFLDPGADKIILLTSLIWKWSLPRQNPVDPSLSLVE